MTDPHVVHTYDQVMTQMRETFPGRSPEWCEAWLLKYYELLAVEEEWDL